MNAPHPTIAKLGVTAVLAAVDGSAATRAAKPCFRFPVPTAARGGEARRATWDEIDMKTREWRIPGQRMKTEQAHGVPLSDAAPAVLADADAIRKTGSDLVFPGTRRGRPLTDSTLSKLPREIGAHAVPHGCRAAFRTRADERTNAPRATLSAMTFSSTAIRSSVHTSPPAPPLPPVP
ncbi:MAG: tyrosine-type recombinase/integrase [Rhodospirillales bacterium]|nr:tyrosine-type recombinase/integrase [Rhodospirillales bacterium]